MASYTTVADWQDVEVGYVVDVTIRRTEDEPFPSGRDDRRHRGEVGGDTVLRYDDAHERTNGHERHAGTDVEHRGPGDARALRPVRTSGGGDVTRLVELAGGGRRQELPAMPALNVTVGERDHLDQPTRRRIKAARAGEELDDDQPVLNFGSYAELGRLLGPKNLELLAAIAEHDHESSREAAERVERDYEHGHRKLPELEDIGVLHLEDRGAGQATKPRLSDDGLEVGIPCSGSRRVGTAAP